MGSRWQPTCRLLRVATSGRGKRIDRGSSTSTPFESWPAWLSSTRGRASATAGRRNLWTPRRDTYLARSALPDREPGPDGRFKSPEQLRKRFAGLGVDGDNGAVVYCGSGVTATHDLLAMELAGLANGRLYAGSWSDWSNRDAPIATGIEAEQGLTIPP